MRKLTNSILAFFRGGHGPVQVASAVALGLLAGFATGWNATLALIVLLAVAANVATRTFCQSWAVGAGLGWLLTPVSFQAGYYLLEKSPLAGMFAGWKKSWVLAAFDFDRFTLTGGLFIGGLLAIPAAWLTARTIRQLAAQLGAAAEQEKTELDPPLRGLAAVACWSVFGSVETGLHAIRRRSAAQFRLLSAAAIMASAGVVWHFHGPELLGRSLLQRISAANEALAEAASIKFYPGESRVVIHDLRLADPEHLDRDRLRVGYIHALVDPAALLRGQVQIEKLLLDNLQCDSPRERRATPQELRSHGFASLSAHDPQVSSPPEPGLPLSSYMHDWKTWEARGRQFRDLIAGIEQFGAGEQEEKSPSSSTAERGYAPLGYSVMRSMHSGCQHVEPAVYVELLRASGLPPAWGLGDGAILEIARLSSQPALSEKSTLLVLSSPAHGAELNVQLDLHEGSRRHAVRFRVQDSELSKLLRSATAKRAVAVRQGRLSLSGTGWISGEHLELPVAMQGENLHLEIAADQHPAGLPSATWNDGLRRLGRFKTTAMIEGSWKAPRLTADPRRLAEDFKRELSTAGETALARAVDRQLANLPQTASRSTATIPPDDYSVSNEESSPVEDADDLAADRQVEIGEVAATSIPEGEAHDRPVIHERWRPKGLGSVESTEDTPDEPSRRLADRYDHAEEISGERQGANPPVGNLVERHGHEENETQADAHLQPESDMPKVVQSSQVDRPSPGKLIIRPELGKELQYPSGNTATADRAAERKAAYEPRLVQDLGVRANPRTPRPVEEPLTSPKQITSGVVTASDSEPAGDDHGPPQTVALRRPADLGLELGYDTRQTQPKAGVKPRAATATQSAAASLEQEDEKPATVALPIRKELPQPATPPAANKVSKSYSLSNRVPSATKPGNNFEAGFNKFTTSVSQSFKKVLPPKTQPKPAPRHEDSSDPFTAEETVQADETSAEAPAQAQNQTKSSKPWYKVFR